MPARRSRSAASLGDLERAVMTVLWDVGPGQSVRQVLESLHTEKELAYTTVLTVLDRLAKKHLVTRVRAGRAWSYSAAASREELTGRWMRRSLETHDDVDRRTAMLHFLDGATQDELADLRAALTEVEQRHLAG